MKFQQTPLRLSPAVFVLHDGASAICKLSFYCVSWLTSCEFSRATFSQAADKVSNRLEFLCTHQNNSFLQALLSDCPLVTL